MNCSDCSVTTFLQQFNVQLIPPPWPCTPHCVWNTDTSCVRSSFPQHIHWMSHESICRCWIKLRERLDCVLYSTETATARHTLEDQCFCDCTVKYKTPRQNINVWLCVLMSAWILLCIRMIIVFIKLSFIKCLCNDTRASPSQRELLELTY